MVSVNDPCHGTRFLPRLEAAKSINVGLQEFLGNVIVFKAPFFQSATLEPAYNKQIDATKTARCRRVLKVTELFDLALYDFDAKKSTCFKWVLVVTELVVSGTQCICLSVTSRVSMRRNVNVTTSYLPYLHKRRQAVVECLRRDMDGIGSWADRSAVWVPLCSRRQRPLVPCPT